MLVRLYLEHCVQFGVLQKETDILEWIQQRGTKMIKELQHTKCKKMVRELALFNHKKRRLRRVLVAVFRYILVKNIVEDKSWKGTVTG